METKYLGYRFSSVKITASCLWTLFTGIHLWIQQTKHLRCKEKVKFWAPLGSATFQLGSAQLEKSQLELITNYYITYIASNKGSWCIILENFIKHAWCLAVSEGQIKTLVCFWSTICNKEKKIHMIIRGISLTKCNELRRRKKEKNKTNECHMKKTLLWISFVFSRL